MIVELRDRYYVETPLGTAEVFYLDTSTSAERFCLLGVFQCETKEMWWWPNSQVRLCESASANRDAAQSPIWLSADMLEMLAPHIARHTSSPFYQSADVR